MMSEILYELWHSGETPPQCCTCNQPAEHKCAVCRVFVCPDHAMECDVCLKQHCWNHLIRAEGMTFCFPDMAVIARESGIEDEGLDVILAQITAEKEIAE